MTTVQEKKERERFLKKFGEHVKSIRIKKGLTGAELARRCYMDKQNVSRFEKGKFNPSLYYLKKISEGLDIEIEELFMNFH